MSGLKPKCIAPFERRRVSSRYSIVINGAGPMHRFVCHLFLLFLLFTSGVDSLGQEAGRSSFGSVSLSGRVLEAQTGEPIAKALVSIRALNLKTVTGPDGRFLLLAVPTGLALRKQLPHRRVPPSARRGLLPFGPAQPAACATLQPPRCSPQQIISFRPFEVDGVRRSLECDEPHKLPG